MHIMKTYLLSYQHEGSTWLLELKAENEQDARKRLSRLQYARLDGELMMKIPTTQTTSGILGRALSFLLGIQGKK